MDKSIKMAGKPPWNLVVHANWVQLARSQRMDQRRVLSRMLLWCVAGEGIIRVNGQEFHLRPDDWFLLPWGRSMSYLADAKNPFRLGGLHLVAHHDARRPIVLHVSHDPDDSLADQPWRTEVTGPSLGGITRGVFQPVDKLRLLATYAAEYFQEIEPEVDGARAIADLLLQELRSRLAPQAPARAVPGELRYLQDYIRQHLREPLSVSQLAEVSAQSVASVGRLFRRYTNRAPSRWLAEARWDHAKLLLRTTTLSIAAVGAEVGLTDPFHFSRFFKRMEGLSPREYQRLRRFL